MDEEGLREEEEENGRRKKGRGEKEDDRVGKGGERKRDKLKARFIMRGEKLPKIIAQI